MSGGGEAKVLDLSCTVQKYEWGKVGKESMVAQLASEGEYSGFVMNDSESYAELWMGTHPKGPSSIKNAFAASAAEPLKDWLKKNEWALSPKIVDHFGDLPFLFKVLSVRKALSIQAHPDKELAKQLHAKDPEHYPDPNHKPEMAIALTKFEALCGFRPVEEIVGFLKSCPEFAAVVDADAAANLTAAVEKGEGEKEIKAALRACYSSYMNCDEQVAHTSLTKLNISLLTKAEKSSLETLILKLNTQYPGDKGLFNVFFLNHSFLEPGEAVFLAANLPHAYLDGDCVECMACSDNVVRAGLTPKFKDVDTLCSMLTYDNGPLASQILRGDDCPQDAKTRIYDPPIEEFTIAYTNLSGGESANLFAVEGPSIAIVVEGKGTVAGEGDERAMEIHKGSCLFIPAGVTSSAKCTDGSLKIYRAYCVKA
eukprot:Nk52_evm11s1178 gene=Nk52_evmTU11s1178